MGRPRWSGSIHFGTHSVLTHREEFRDSLGRCLQSEGFVESFYERFIAADDEIRQRFRHTDWERQRTMLAASLRISGDAIDGKPEALQRLKELGVSHDRWHHDIKPEWYKTWLDMLLATAAQTDPYWSESTEEAWRATLQHVVNRMQQAYDG